MKKLLALISIVCMLSYYPNTMISEAQTNGTVQTEFCTVDVYCTTNKSSHSLKVYHNMGTLLVNGNTIPDPVCGYSIVVVRNEPVHIQYDGISYDVDLDIIPIDFALACDGIQEFYCCIDLVNKTMCVAGKARGLDYNGYWITLGMADMDTGYDQHNEIYLNGGLVPFMGRFPLVDGDNSFRVYAQWETIYGEWNNALRVNFK